MYNKKEKITADIFDNKLSDENKKLAIENAHSHTFENNDINKNPEKTIFPNVKITDSFLAV